MYNSYSPASFCNPKANSGLTSSDTTSNRASAGVRGFCSFCFSSGIPLHHHISDANHGGFGITTYIREEIVPIKEVASSPFIKIILHYYELQGRPSIYRT